MAGEDSQTVNILKFECVFVFMSVCVDVGMCGQLQSGLAKLRLQPESALLLFLSWGILLDPSFQLGCQGHPLTIPSSYTTAPIFSSPVFREKFVEFIIAQ